MNKFKSLVLTVIGLLCSVSVSAEDFEVDGIYYNITSSTDMTVEVTYRGYSYNSYRGEYSGAVNIPESVTYNGNTYSVTSIGDYAFAYCLGLTLVVIPNSVTSIGGGAFYYCESLKVVLNNSSLTFTKGSSSYGYIAYYAIDVYNGYEQVDDFIFAEANDACYIGLYIGNATELVLPANYKGRNYHIGQYAFYGCSGLTSVVIPESVTSIGDNVFNGCSALTSLTIGAGVLSIGSNKCSPTKTIWLTNTPPSGWKNLEGTINYVANEQYGSSSNVKVYPYLSSIFEADGVKYVPVSPSERTCDAIDCNYDCAVEEINIGETVSYRGIAMTVQNIMPYIAYSHKYLKNITLSNKGDIHIRAFYGCTDVTNVTISNEGDIGTSAFAGAMTSENATINITNKGNIGYKAFYGCSAITNATISNEGSIGASAFEGAMKSANATINVASKGYIDSKAFYGCSGIKTAVVDIRNPNSSNESFIFEDWTSPYTRNSSTSSKTYNFTLRQSNMLSFDWWVSSESGYDKLIVDLDGSTVLIESGEQSGTFSQSVSAGTHTLVVKYTKDGSGTSGQDQARVYNITIGSGSSDISQEAFRGCTSLASLTLGDSIQSIGESAFRECNRLTEVKIPNLVTQLEPYSFAGTTALKHIELGDSLQGSRTYTFKKYHKIANH